MIKTKWRRQGSPDSLIFEQSPADVFDDGRAFIYKSRIDLYQGGACIQLFPHVGGSENASRRDNGNTALRTFVDVTDNGSGSFPQGAAAETPGTHLRHCGVIGMQVLAADRRIGGHDPCHAGG